MDELGFNKIAAAVLATALGVMLLRELPHQLIHSDTLDVPVYSVGPIEVASTDEVVDLPFPQPEWVAAMDADRGAKVFKKCQSCHNVDEGGANGTGPALWGVVGNPTGAHDGFAYSTAMTSTGYSWTFEELDEFLTKPAAHIKGTKMAFVGLKKPEDRAAVIEYLRVHDSAPEPRPAPAAIEPAVETPAENTVEVIEEPAADPTAAPDGH